MIRPTFHRTLVRTALAAAVALAWSASPAAASISFAFNDTSGYDSSDLKTVASGDVNSGVFLRGASGESRAAMQTFTVDTAITINAVNILVNRLADNATGTLKLVEFGSAPATPDVSRATVDALTPLISYDYTVSGVGTLFGTPGNFSNVLSTFTWSLAADVTLSPGTVYALAIDGTTDDTPVAWRRQDINGGDPYAGGVGYYSPEGNANYQNDGFGSNVTGDWSLGLVEVPEPGSLALLAAGAVCLLGRRR